MLTPEAARQLSLLGRRIKVVEELLMQDLAQNQTRLIEVRSGD